MDRIQRMYIAATPEGRAYLDKMDAEKAKQKRERSSRRSSRSPRHAEPSKAAKREAKRDARSECRAACEARANGRCEACGSYRGSLLHLDHFWGRAREESVESCWMLCLTCDREKTENVPSRGAWLGAFSIHCERHQYRDQLAKVDAAMVLDRAKHPSRNRCQYGALVCTHAQCQPAARAALSSSPASFGDASTVEPSANSNANSNSSNEEDGG